MPDRRDRNGPNALAPGREMPTGPVSVEPAPSASTASEAGSGRRSPARPRRDRGHVATVSRPTRWPEAADRPIFADGMLKLMLILLAFFVFLHSRSEPSAQRSAPILDSLALRFASAADPSREAAARAAALDVDPGIQLRRRLVGHLPISAGEVEVPGSLLAFDLHETALFQQDTAEILRVRMVLLRRLADALGESRAGRDKTLVVTTGWPEETTSLTAARLSTLEAVFADATSATRRLELGLATLPAGIWRFSIRAGQDHAS